MSGQSTDSEAVVAPEVEPANGSVTELPSTKGSATEAPNLIVVPPEPAPIRGGSPAPRIETWLVALFFGVVYGVVGYFLLTDGRIVNFDSLQRLNDAYMVWWNSPPKLAAIPLDSAPLGSIAYMPMTLIKPVATSLVAMPILSAVAAGFMMAAINSILRRCEMSLGLRLAVLLLFGLNPMLVFYAGNGDITVIGMMLAAVGLLSVISWRMTSETRHLAGAGLAIGIAVMFDYGYALWAVGFVIALMMVGGERESPEDRQRSSLFVFLTPALYALLVWTLINFVLLGSPFGWINADTGLIQVNTTGSLDAITATLGSSLGDLFDVVLGVAPLGLAVIVLLLVAGIVSRNALAIGLFAVLLLAASVPVIRTLSVDQAGLLDLSVGLPLALAALAGAAWLYWSEEGWRMGVVAVTVIGLVAAIPLGWNAMKDYAFQNQAQAFTRWVEGDGTQEGTASIGDFTVGIDPEVAMASYINSVLPQTKDSILVDENFSYGPMILSGRPQLFFDRTDTGEGGWEAVLDNPYGAVAYMLITTGRGGDQLRKRYPTAISGGELGITPIFRTQRYVLLEVSGSKPPAAAAAKPGEVVPNSLPSPFTPQKPPDPANPDATTAVPGIPPDAAVTPTPAPAPTTGPGPSGGTTAPQIEGE